MIFILSIVQFTLLFALYYGEIENMIFKTINIPYLNVDFKKRICIQAENMWFIYYKKWNNENKISFF